ncbi:glycosyltransferase family 1 protein [Pseudoneobacillus rhizosphaerae]|uniref:Glycosyltransferase EpsF n=1 Tax=Pseudoneobacillus rhizosphaerae TaxID=2880968 RepID=A0A9C7G6I8_9BACI|nr:glycosyltransferase family 1 protein [Pseudoneobacillus rhizosphaerae]CAG9606595.1 Putative glycosyltransferase EpsF [Pseudoneobacillus rhizosphaerae]
MSIEKPKRILHVMGKMDTGGAETLIMNIYRNIDRTKVQFDFIVHTKDKGYYDDEIFELGGNIFRVPNFSLLNLKSYYLAWVNFFKTNNTQYTIIHSHIRSTAAIFLSIARKFGLVTISHSHSISSGKGINAIIKKILQYPLRYIADYFFSCSKEAGEWLFGKRVTSNRKFKIIPNGISLEKYTFSNSTRKKIRKNLNINEKTFVIGHVGRFEYPKNHEFLIETFKLVKKDNENSKLLLIGDGILTNYIKEKVKQSNLTNCVYFMGIRDDIPDLLQVMDIFVFPSQFEGFGIAALEAQASGLKTFVSDTIPEAVKVTDNIETISLSKPAEFWAEEILKYKNGYRRRDTMIKIKNAGYDVKEIANWLEEFYING